MMSNATFTAPTMQVAPLQCNLRRFDVFDASILHKDGRSETINIPRLAIVTIKMIKSEHVCSFKKSDIHTYYKINTREDENVYRRDYLVINFTKSECG